jgi:Ca2+-binding RTX toxin-like protein
MTLNIIAATSDAPDVEGTALDDRIIGVVNSGVLHGNDGDDVINGGADAYGDSGDDVVWIDNQQHADGGAGIDTLFCYGNSDVHAPGFHFDLQTSTSIGSTQVTGFERLEAIIPWGNDVIGGGAYDDVLDGGQGGDVLRGRGGDDLLTDGTDYRRVDRLYGGSGDDTLVITSYSAESYRNVYDGGDGNDTLKVKAYYRTGTVTIDLSAGTFVDGPNITSIERLIYDGGGYGADITGAGLDDQLTGGNGENTLNGAGGDDLLTGYTLRDHLYGDDGNDQLNGDVVYDWDPTGTYGGNDYLSGGSGDDILRGVAGSDVLEGGSGSDRLEGGLGNDRLDGGDAADTLVGGKGNDMLDGGAGSDTLVGSLGKDVLTGGDGRDLFIFAALESRPGGGVRDIITDFEPGVDKIDLSGLELSFGELSFKAVGSGLIVYGDVNGDSVMGANEFGLQLTGITTLNESDFIF